MPAICFYFQVHQPHRVRKFVDTDIGQGFSYFEASPDSNLNKEILLNVANRCYLPTNKILTSLLKKFPQLRVGFSLSGVLLEQLEEFSPPTLESFKRLVGTGQVELLSETYYHSLSFVYSRDEFISQVELHTEKIKSLFGVTPQVFRNTELIYNNDTAQVVESMGFKGILTEGADRILGDRSPNFLYHPVGTQNIKLFLKNYRLSDDVAFRFSDTSWSEFPLTAEKYVKRLFKSDSKSQIVNLFMDYETFGEHQRESTKIFEFLKNLPREILKYPDSSFITPSEAISKFPTKADLDIPNFISWADVERDLSAWLGNPIQDNAATMLYSLEKSILQTDDSSLIQDWRRLQTSDHFYYMCTKWFNDGDIHKYFNPYRSPYEAFFYYRNIVKDLKLRLDMLKSTK